MPATAIILARAGSKGLPGKNVMELAGRPCLAWTMQHALQAETVNRVIVSTDDPKARRVAEELATLHDSIQCVDRPETLASDTATVDSAARHAHDAIGRPEGPVVVLYANVPVRPAGLIDRAVQHLVEHGAHSVQSYAPVGKHHPWWTARLDETGHVSPWEGDILNHNVFRRQDLPPAVVPDGGVLVVSPQALHLELDPPVPAGPHAFFGHTRLGVRTKPGEVIDIDTPIDAKVAEAVLREQLAQANTCSASKAGWRDAHR